MVLEPIGIVTILLGVLTIAYGVSFGIAVLASTLVLGSAAALNLPALGGSSVQPSHLLLVFVTFAALMRPGYIQASLACFRYPGPAFWFAGFVIYSALTSFFFPRIFAGATIVYSSGRTATGMASILASPLGPSTANMTQTVYMLGSLVCFALIAGYTYRSGSRFVAWALVTSSLTCLFFAFADIATFMTGQQHLLDFVRNANYAIMVEAEINGFKRIVGSFPEASSYGAYALTLFAFVLILTIEGFHYKGIGLIATVLGITVLLCTSSTAYAASVTPLALTLVLCSVYIVKRKATTNHIYFLVFSVLIVPLVVVGMMIVPPVWNAVSSLVDETLISKLESDSGLERMSWNRVALISFLDTYGFGAGLGSVRASSFLTAVLSNVGIVGAVLFAFFIVSLVWSVVKRRGSSRTERSIGIAALVAALTLLTAACVSSTAADLGLLFSVTAGIAAGYGRGAQVVQPGLRRLAARPPVSASMPASPGLP